MARRLGAPLHLFFDTANRLATRVAQEEFMNNVVTIGIPVYKRLQYLPAVLNIVASQDYPHIELLVSDNGVNGRAVPDIVSKHYRKPYRFRQNPSTVSISTHFNQLIHEASGEYFIVLADDDEITPNYASDLVCLLEKHPQASVAFAVQQTIDDDGNVISSSKNTVPEVLSGPDFIRAIWGTHEYGFRSLSTYLARRRSLMACGGYPEVWAGTSDEDLLMVKLCVDNFVGFSARCAFRKRFDESSYGYSITMQDLARGIKEFLKILDSDAKLSAYAASHPVEWSDSKRYLVEMVWKTYYYRWTGLYKSRLTPFEWIRAGFAMPFVPDYYRAVSHECINALLNRAKRLFPFAYNIYRAARHGRS